MNPYLEKFVPFMDFIAEFLGRNTELVLHDLSDLDRSVVAIRNGHISQRQIGAPITDLALQLLNEAKYKDLPFIANYQGKAFNGHIVKSGTFFIKDEKGEIVGMLCLNADLQNSVKARDLLDVMIDTMKIPEETSEITENLTANVNDLIENNILKVFPEVNGGPKQLTQKEKVDIVHQLNEMGTFMMKGSVGYVADRLDVSIPTIYRYLNIVKKDD